MHGSILRGDTPGGPLIQVLTGSDMQGTIAIDGSFTNAAPNDVEIVCRPFDTTGLPFFVVNYDGAASEDPWPAAGSDPNSGGTFEIRPSAGASTFYTSPDPNNGVFKVSSCIGDLDNDGSADDDDLDELDQARLWPGQTCYGVAYPELLGSRVYHGDLTNDGAVTCLDREWHDFLRNVQGIDLCCFTNRADIVLARLDGDQSGAVDLADLAGLLAVFGSAKDDPNSNPPYTAQSVIYDYNALDCNAVPGCGSAGADQPSNSVELADLAGLLAGFGQSYTPCGGGGGGGFGPMSSSSAALTQSVDAYDTSAYSGGGFAGEDDHFVFDLIIEMVDPNDDWTVAGALVTTANGATLRLAVFADPNDPNNPMIPEPASASEPDKYGTFVGVPKGVNVSGRFTSPGASYAGGYTGAVAYVSTGVNVAWFDLDDESHDGPAAIMRIVLDVSAVTGADTSGGFGSVYFSDSGPTDPGHIKVADFESAAAAESAGEELNTLLGAFYVTD